MQVFQCNVFTELDQSTGLVADTVAHLESQSRPGLWCLVVDETEQVRFEFDRFAKSVEG